MNVVKCGRVLDVLILYILIWIMLRIMLLIIYLLYMYVGKVFVLFNLFSIKIILGEIGYVYIYCDFVGNIIIVCFRVLI